MSFPQYVRETESDSWQFATTGMLSEKCVDLSKGSKTEVGELTKRYVYGRVGATKEVLQLPAGSPCIPQRPSRRDEAPYFDNYASECASTLKCYEMRWQPYKGASYIGQPYLGYGCCRPSSMDDATWEESHLKTKCEYATMEAWFAWRRVDKGVPHYHYACIDKDDGYGHWCDEQRGGPHRCDHVVLTLHPMCCGAGICTLRTTTRNWFSALRV